jgi:hypothetical protein
MNMSTTKSYFGFPRASRLELLPDSDLGSAQFEHLKTSSIFLDVTVINWTCIQKQYS